MKCQKTLVDYVSISEIESFTTVIILRRYGMNMMNLAVTNDDTYLGFESGKYVCKELFPKTIHITSRNITRYYFLDWLVV